MSVWKLFVLVLRGQNFSTLVAKMKITEIGGR